MLKWSYLFLAWWWTALANHWCRLFLLCLTAKINILIVLQPIILLARTTITINKMLISSILSLEHAHFMRERSSTRCTELTDWSRQIDECLTKILNMAKLTKEFRFCAISWKELIQFKCVNFGHKFWYFFPFVAFILWF